MLNYRNASISLAILVCLTCKPSGRDEVKKYAEQLPRVSVTAQQITPSAAGVMYYARKDTLKYNGNVVIGNWILGTSDAGCTNAGTAALLLTSISNFDDLGPCPNGSSLVRAVIK